MLINKYKPEKITDIVGQTTAVSNIVNFVKNFEPGKCLLIHGPTGIGKTLTVHLVAKHLGYHLVELNASESCKGEDIKNKLLPAIKNTSLFVKGKIILIDEIDNFTREDRGGIEEIIKIIKQTRFPVILTANNAYKQKLRTLRNLCELIQMRRVNVLAIEKKLKQIAFQEKIKITEEKIKEISRNSSGDLRAAIHDIETSSHHRERKITIFDTLKIIFKSNNLKETLQSIDRCDKKLNDIMWWIEENIKNEYKKPEEIATACEMLAKADMFMANIRYTNNYRNWFYAKNMMANITTIRKGSGWVSYKPPSRLIILGKSKAKRGELNKIYEQYGKKMHCSKKCIRNQSGYLKLIEKNLKG